MEDFFPKRIDKVSNLILASLAQISLFTLITVIQEKECSKWPDLDFALGEQEGFMPPLNHID